MATVDLEGVGKTYPGGIVAVADLDLAVADAEVMVLVGPSGCGKSTVLRLVAGLETPTAGTVRIDGRDVAGLPPQARNVAMVFQDYALYPHLTVQGNLAFPLRMRGLARDEIQTRVAGTSEMLGLGPLLGRLPRELSGGQRQRVAMGRALVRDPDVFLLDEPLSNLDAKLRSQVRGEIEALQRRTRRTMLYVTHDQVEAMTLGDRVAVLDRGRLRQVGTPREIYDRPADTFVAGFMGSPPMNLLPARLAAEGDAVVVSIDGRPVARLAADAVRGGALPAEATAGLRPEAVRLGDAGAAGALGARAVHVEALGHESLVHLDADGIPLVARVPGGDAPAPEASVGVLIDAGRLYLFSPAGEAIAAPSTTSTR